jgi:dipeptidase E
LTELVGAEARVAVSANAFDMEPAAERRDWLDNEMRALASAGLSPIELDLRGYYGDPAALAAVVAAVDMVWGTGGNVFVLRKALKLSGLDELLRVRLREDSLAYGGCSAGACVCGPTLRGIDVIDNARAAGEPMFDGLGLVDYSIAPHAGACGEAGEAIARLVTYFQKAKMPYRALRDGQAIVVHGERATTIEFY